MEPLSPFRYPGGKQILSGYLESLLKENLLLGSPFYESHAGGASISLYLLSNGFVSKATLIEYDPLVYSFWKSVKDDSQELCRRIKSLDLSVKTWEKMRKYLDRDAVKKHSTISLGLAGLFFNRTNFSGILHAGPIGGIEQKSKYKIDCRFNKDRIIGLIKTIAGYSNKLSIVHDDAVHYLKKNSKKITKEGGVVYVDPPYYVQGERLYRHHYKSQQHLELAQFLLAQKFSWIVSYDNHPDISKMFKGQRIIPISFNYTVKESRKVDELLIANIPLLKPIYSFGAESRKQKKAA